jgi:hypothetical protein
MSNHTGNPDQEESAEAEDDGRTFDEDKEAAIYAFIEHSIESEYAAEQYSVNTLFQILTNPGRRYVLTFLLQSDGFVTVSELVDFVLNRTDASMTDDGFRQEIAAELSHTHLPNLEEEGFIEYNMERQLVMPTELTRIVEPYLRIALAQQKIAAERAAES